MQGVRLVAAVFALGLGGLSVAAPAASAATLSFSVNSQVDETTPGDGACSLREAISAANAGTGTADCPGTPSATTVINVPAGHYTLIIPPATPDDDSPPADNNTGDLNISSAANVTIQGANARTTIIDANQIDRVLEVESGATVTLDNLTITGGRAPDSPAFPNGGGIWNEGVLAINDSTITANRSGDGFDNGCGNCSAGSAGSGGGIFNVGFLDMNTFQQTGSLSLTDSTVSANTTGNGGNAPSGTAGSGGQGAGIESLAPLNVSNSTITGNVTGNSGIGGVADANGGDGAGVLSAGVTTIVDTTIASNTTGTGTPNGQVGGIDQANGSVTLANTLLASNGGNNCGGTIGDNGHNLSFPATDTSCPNAFISGDPLLAALGNNGGPTDTMALGAGSAAIDQVPATAVGCSGTDQRGVTRPQGPACDIGAFERVSAMATLAPGALSFPLAPALSQPQWTIGPAQALTLTNSNAPLIAVSQVVVTGTDAADFLVTDDGCTDAMLAGVGSQCQLLVRFAPSKQGPENATLSVTDNTANSPQTASLSGTGGSPASGPAGATGATGATGAAGRAGPAGKVELVTCVKVTKLVKVRRRKPKRVTQTVCTTRLVTSPVKFVTTGTVRRAALWHAGRLYASGSATLKRNRIEVIFAAGRRIVPGRYTLRISGRYTPRSEPVVVR